MLIHDIHAVQHQPWRGVRASVARGKGETVRKGLQKGVPPEVGIQRRRSRSARQRLKVAPAFRLLRLFEAGCGDAEEPGPPRRRHFTDDGGATTDAAVYAEAINRIVRRWNVLWRWTERGRGRGGGGGHGEGSE